jgi:hypothetical protein
MRVMSVPRARSLGRVREDPLVEENRWIARRPDSRALTVTPAGRKKLTELGVAEAPVARLVPVAAIATPASRAPAGPLDTTPIRAIPAIMARVPGGLVAGKPGVPPRADCCLLSGRAEAAAAETRRSASPRPPVGR